jgi:hypothetical protein
MRSQLQNNQSKMDWRCGSNSRVQNPEFKPHSHQKNKNKKELNRVNTKVKRTGKMPTIGEGFQSVTQRQKADGRMVTEEGKWPGMQTRAL